MTASYPNSLKTFTTKAAGGTILAEHVNSLQDEIVAVETTLGIKAGQWQSYTPTWTAITTNPTIGDGQLYGYYYVIGKICTMAIYLRFGSTTYPGVGNWEFALPVASKSSWSGYVIGNGLAAQVSTPRKYSQVIPLMQAAQTKIAQYLWVIPETEHYFINATAPFTWSGATSDSLYIHLAYPIN